MIKFDILTLFPEVFERALDFSLLARAKARALVNFNIVNIRDFTSDKHNTADDSAYGGGAGMVMKPEPLAKAIRHCRTAGSKVILLSPSGIKLTQAKALGLAKEKRLTLICGHYEGIDDRIRERYVDEEISIGDYVLTGGEYPALVLIDAVSRMIPGVVKEKDSIVNDSFYQGLLDYPSYTRPEKFMEMDIPAVLKSGNHKAIARWRRKESLRKTLFRRPELLAQAGLDKSDRTLIQEVWQE